MSALTGLKVLDLTRVLAGPLCTMILGDMGADVIKVEPPSGDETRAWGPPSLGGEAAYYLGVNRNKRGMVLDFGTQAARDVLRAMIKATDVLVENYKFGTLEKWGFDADWFLTEAPRVVRCSITGYGQVGPKAHLPGYDFVLQAETGGMSITGPQDGGPTKHGVAVIDLSTGLYAVIAILGALSARQTTGRGQNVTVSLYQTGIAMLANVASNHLASGKAPGRYGNGHPNIVPYRTFTASDGDLALAVGNDMQFRRFATVAGHPEWADDPLLTTNAARVGNRALADGLAAGEIARHPVGWWIEHLRAQGVPCGAVNDVPTALADAQTAALGMIQTLQHPTAGAISGLGFPFTMSDSPPSTRRAPPLFGQHTAEVLREFGFDPDVFETGKSAE